MRTSSPHFIYPLITLNDYASSIGARFLRGVDSTSTAGGYRAGLRLRALPRLDHMRGRKITTSLVNRAIDNRIPAHSRSNLKSTIAALTRMLGEAVRDDLIARNPVLNRASRRDHRIAEAFAATHQSYDDHIVLSAFLAARSSEVVGLIVGDVDWTSKLVAIERQHSPGAGGLSIKPPKRHRVCRVPIIEPLEPVLRRLTGRWAHNLPLLRGPRGGVITTAALRDATSWDQMVASLGFPRLRRLDLRHAGATWFANAGIPIHVVGDVLGHASVDTTRAYLHTRDSTLQNAAEPHAPAPPEAAMSS